jgi:sugar-specific transcriptional regulator TrmB
MESVVEKLQKVGLTRYEAKAYLSLLSDHLNSATKLSEKSGVPRTKIYQVLESLERKGWIRIYSGIPLLFKAVDPRVIFEKIKKDYDEFLELIQTTLNKEVMKTKEKFVIKKSDVGLRSLKDEMRKAKTIWISNATTDFLKKVGDTFSEDAEVKVLLFPGERRTGHKNVRFKEAEVKIVCMVRNKEVPSTSIILDESRIFTVFEDPVNHQYLVDEMLYDECTKCFLEWYNLGWDSAKGV